MSEVIVLNTGTANVASVLAGLRRAGATPRLSEDGAEVDGNAPLVLPGVASFGAVMSALEEMGVVAALKARIEAGRPTLCVCVGLQALCESSEESPGFTGLGIVPGAVERFSGVARVPHLGWNQVEASDDASLLSESGYAYFANSYRLTTAPTGWTVARCDYGGAFIAAMERGRVLACQFHPELSGAWGQRLLARWLARATDGGAL